MMEKMAEPSILSIWINRRVPVEIMGDMKDLYITDARVEEIVDAGYENVKDGAYAEAFEKVCWSEADFIEDGVAVKFNYNEDTGEYTYFDTEEESRPDHSL